MSVAVLIVVLVICLLLEGFFSGSEMALVSADKYRLALGVDGGSKLALSALHMVKRPAKFFSTTLLGTNLCTVAGSTVTTLFIIERFGEACAPFAILYWPLTLIFGELVPKSIYQHYADRLVLRVSPILFGTSILFYPVIWALSKLTDSLLGGVARREIDSPPISREELGMLLDMGMAGSSDMMQAERTLISRIFDLADKKVKNIMTPLIDVISIPATASRDEAAGILERHEYSRVPVYEGRIINIVGVLAGTDLLFGDSNALVKDLVKPAYYVPEEMPLDELLVAMKRRGEPLAVAVDEYGAATGIVTAEDLLEEVVGEIRDEHDDNPPQFTRLGRHRYLLSARMEIDEANERLKLDIPYGDYKTVAGFVISRFEKIPRAGESFQSGRFKFIVRRATDRAVLEIEVAETVASDVIPA